MRCRRAPRDSKLPTRRLALLALLVAPGAARPATRPCEPAPRVLFVCPAGTVKSAIAREALRARAARAGIAVSVLSRGLRPEDHVSSALAANLRADGLDPAREPALALTRDDIAAADIIIAFDEAAQAPGLESARSWRIPSWNTDYASAKAALETRLDSLLTELRERGRGPVRPSRPCGTSRWPSSS